MIKNAPLTVKIWWAQGWCHAGEETLCCTLYDIWIRLNIAFLFLGSINLPVDWLAATHLLVLGMDQELVVHSLHHDLLGGVLAHIKPQLQLLWAAILALFSYFITFLLKPATYCTSFMRGDLSPWSQAEWPPMAPVTPGRRSVSPDTSLTWRIRSYKSSSVRFQTKDL